VDLQDGIPAEELKAIEAKPRELRGFTVCRITAARFRCDYRNACRWLVTGGEVLQ
jgi:hypothetical protein